MQRLRTQHYYNPHNPPPGGHRQALLGPNSRVAYVGPGGANMGRWNAIGKSVEIQRSQVDELFKSMKDGDELPETEPRTSSYPALLNTGNFVVLTLNVNSPRRSDEVISASEESVDFHAGA